MRVERFRTQAASPPSRTSLPAVHEKHERWRRRAARRSAPRRAGPAVPVSRRGPRRARSSSRRASPSTGTLRRRGRNLKALLVARARWPARRDARTTRAQAARRRRLPVLGADGSRDGARAGDRSGRGLGVEVRPAPAPRKPTMIAPQNNPTKNAATMRIAIRMVTPRIVEEAFRAAGPNRRGTPISRGRDAPGTGFGVRLSRGSREPDRSTSTPRTGSLRPSSRCPSRRSPSCRLARWRAASCAR